MIIEVLLQNKDDEGENTGEFETATDIFILAFTFFLFSSPKTNNNALSITSIIYSNNNNNNVRLVLLSFVSDFAFFCFAIMLFSLILCLSFVYAKYTMFLRFFLFRKTGERKVFIGRKGFCGERISGVGLIACFLSAERSLG